MRGNGQAVMPGDSAGRDRSTPDRFVAFAFAAADLLVEADEGGRIGFAAGAFTSRLGRTVDEVRGEAVERLIAPPDRSAFRTAIGLLAARGRLTPTAIRIDTPEQPSMALSGLALPGQDGRLRLSLCFAALPSAGPDTASLPAGPGFATAAEEQLRAGGGHLALLELRGPDGVLAPRPALLAEISGLLSESALSAELAPGRFGVLPERLDLVDLAARLEALLQQNGLSGTVHREAISLDAPSLSGLQATRALRFALSAFAQGGPDGLARAGFKGGLAGFVATAARRAGAISALLTARRFRLAFQPIVALADRSPHHYEALIRPITTPDMPLGQASEFVTFAETIGLSEELDWAVAATVAEAAQGAGGARIALNLSALSLQSPAFRQRLLALLDRHPTLAARLLVEVTETAEIEDEAAAIETAQALRVRGLPVCIDDFGAGAAAFRMLRVLPVDYVKVDGHYVGRAVENARDRGFIAAMVDLSAAVGARVIAERVETEAEAALMAELGVAFGQGWLFGKPGALPGGA